MLRRIALTAAAAAVLAAGALTAPAAHASTSGNIAQPSCWALKYRCLVATPATASPNLKYQTQPGNEWNDPPAFKYGPESIWWGD